MIDDFHGENFFLSNFYPLNGKRVTSEHWYQAMKTVTEEDSVWVMLAASPNEAKKRGRKVKVREDWEEIKLSVMRQVLELKFDPKTYPELVEKLLATGDQKLVEGNYWHDAYWGVCDGMGHNWLGHLLMARRAELRGS